MGQMGCNSSRVGQSLEMSTTDIFAQVVAEDFQDEIFAFLESHPTSASTGTSASVASTGTSASEGRVRVLSNVTLGMASGELDKVRLKI
jgi:hypothetical protein